MEPRFQDTKNITRMERIRTHSHISDLGIFENMNPAHHSQGLVGQLEARKAAGVIVLITDMGKIAASSQWPCCFDLW